MHRVRPLDEIWFDGAGSAGREYDWERIGRLVQETQPEAMVFHLGPATIRWIGNEDGLASDPVDYVVRDSALNVHDDATVDFGTARYLPPECDVSLRTGWFWNAQDAPKTLDHLLTIHDRSWGLGAGLLLNIPPDTRGRIDPHDARRLDDLAAALDSRYGRRRELEMLGTDGCGTRFGGGPAEARRLELREDLTRGQRILAHRVRDADGRVVAEGRSVGVRRIHPVPDGADLTCLTVELDGDDPRLDGVAAFL
ncbi:alpha-L-fucosidase [Brachybacterium sp. EF45031]|uniref:hypothetical protein n=1 Tax=Brachybacterium sillae TaxID=2810536 RepID=UPI00217D38CF|nr:hypothetical protein [Brachybacterium sillae]MCS6712613.1 alpha-L-fucosidase [Brachybacterium sillae]